MALGLCSLGAATVLVACSAAPIADTSPVVTAPPQTSGLATSYWRAELDAEGARWVDETLASLTTDELVGQLIIPWIPGGYQAEDSPEFEELADQVERLGLGGVSISIGLPHTYVAKLNALQARAKVPLLVTADFENGGPGMRINHSYAIPSLLPQGGGTSFPPTMAFGAIGDPSFAYEYGRVTAIEARAVGVHMIFAPVLDVNSNPDNPVINTRSFGESPGAVARLGAAYIRGIHAGGAFATAKHFPGHGDTQTDSHIGLPVIPADRNRLESVELVPFNRAVLTGVDAVMTAHVAMPGILGAGAPPATLSPELMTGVLRDEMGFDGVLFTDALRMGAITDTYGGGEAAVLSVLAGSDVVLAPETVPGAIDALLDATRSGRISRAQLEQSVRRILELKARAGLHLERMVPFEDVSRVVGQAEHVAAADTAASRSVVLVKDPNTLVPLAPSADSRVLSVTYARPVELVAGTTFDAELRLRTPSVDAVRISDESGAEKYAELNALVDSADYVVVHAYVPPRSGSGSVGVAESFRAWVDGAVARRPLLMISLGNPYLLRDLPNVDSYMVAWGNHEVSQRAAVRALFGEQAITGRLPITIPPAHAIGTGLDRDQIRTFTRVAARDPLAEAGILPGRRPRTETPDSTQLRATTPPATNPRPEPAPTRPTATQPERPGTTQDPPQPEASRPPTTATTPPPADARPETRLPPADRLDTSGTLLTDDATPPFPARPDVARNIPIRISPIEAQAHEVGMSEDILTELDSTVVSAISAGAAPGAVVAVGRRGKLVRLRGYGRLDTEPESTPVDEATMYDLASLTKVVATTTGAMLLLERGQLDLDETVVSYLPWWSAGDPAKAQVTVRQLLLHRAGLPPFRRFYAQNRGRQQFQDAIGALPLEYPPGTQTTYSDIGLMTLGFIIEAQSGMPLDRFLDQEVWSRLGMQDTGFNPDPALLGRIAPTEVDTLYRDGKVHGEVHDENAHAAGGVIGHAGLFGSARDLAVFADMMLRSGTLEACSPNPGSGVPCSAARPQPTTLMNASTIRLFTRRHDGASSRALGWDTPSGRSSAGEYFTARSFGHTGFTGTSMWMDPERELFVIVLTNRVNPTRENSLHVALRRTVADLASISIVDQTVERRR